jgi:hypothetical protein
VILATQLSRDEEERRLVAVSEAYRVKEQVAAEQVLHPQRSLPLREYLELVSGLRAECNEKRIAVGAYRKKMEDQLIVAH